MLKLACIVGLVVVSAVPASAQMLDFRGNGNSPIIIAPDRTYRGNLNNNQFDPNSVNNQLGRYGNPLSADSPRNPLGRYGNPLSPNYIPLGDADND